MDLVVIVMLQLLLMVLVYHMDCRDVRLVQLFLVYAILHDDFETRPMENYKINKKISKIRLKTRIEKKKLILLVTDMIKFKEIKINLAYHQISQK